MFGTAAGRGYQVWAVELGTGERQGCPDTGDAVREVRHRRVGAGAEAPRHEGPAGASRQGFRLGHEHSGRLLGQPAGAGHSEPPGPQRREQHARCAEGEVIDARIREEARRPNDYLGPAIGGRERRQTGHCTLSPGGIERGEYADCTDQPVEVGAVGLVRDSVADTIGDRVGQALLFGRPGPRQTDLRQHVGETTHSAVHAIAVGRDGQDFGGLRRCPGPGNPGSVLLSHLVKDPSPRSIGEAAVRLRRARGHLPMMTSRGGPQAGGHQPGHPPLTRTASGR